MPLFGPKTKSPQDLVKSLKESLGQLAKEKGEKEAKKVTVFVNGPCLINGARWKFHEAFHWFCQKRYWSLMIFTGPEKPVSHQQRRGTLTHLI